MPVFNKKMSTKTNNRRNSATHNKNPARTNPAGSPSGSRSPTVGAACSPINSMIRRIEMENGSHNYQNGIVC